MNPEIDVILRNVAALFVIIELEHIVGRFFLVYLHKFNANETVNNEEFLIFENDQRSYDIAFAWVSAYLLIYVMFHSLAMLYGKLVYCPQVEYLITALENG
jgi:hypothetical protein